ncbi:M23 family metallopeptidase [Coralliovum pocilloporae]|uniref:M23 family metallopeptidase n=1 Tax=Coralliovum pocilloporae TaxID=3066369 RepID=UPI003306A848
MTLSPLHKATRTASLFVATLFISSVSAEPFLSLPVACTIGDDCFVQQYPDVDQGSGIADYTCGSSAYDGHKGTDIRVRTLREIETGVAVLSSAGGTVVALRNSEPDRIVATAEDRARIRGKECGNGVVIRHEGGFETQYCHMKQNSVSVREGQTIERGETLGLMGYSGDAAFPHLHLSVRKNGQPVDPFTGKRLDAGCGHSTADTLWQPDTLDKLSGGTGQLLASGFTDQAPDFGILTAKGLQKPDFQNSSEALVIYIWAINVVKGDEIRLSITGPGGFSASRSLTLDRNRAQQFLFTGKRQPKAGWSHGTYSGRVSLIRNGKPLREETHQVSLR